MEGIEVKLARIRAGLKQYQLAAKVGITPVQLCRFELGRIRLPPGVLEKIRQGLDEAQSKTKA